MRVHTVHRSGFKPDFHVTPSFLSQYLFTSKSLEVRCGLNLVLFHGWLQYTRHISFTAVYGYNYIGACQGRTGLGVFWASVASQVSYLW